MPYNPFNKPMSEPLVEADLQELVSNQVAEGYYIEYKGDTFPANEKVAKSVASFANTYGGWYFIGINANKQQNVIIDIPGFDLSIIKDPITKVRDIIKSHINPIPAFFPQLVLLNNNKAVLVVYVPDRQDTPFITSDGRIYRRNSDSSDPVPETDRHAVDRLVDNGHEAEKKFEKFCQDERTFSQAEDGVLWLQLFIAPYPDGIVNKRGINQSESLAKIIELSKNTEINFGNASDNVNGSLPFNLGQVTPASAIFRQIGNEGVAFNTLSCELFKDGSAKFFIPLKRVFLLETEEIAKLSSKKAKSLLQNFQLLESNTKSNFTLLKFIDLEEIFQLVCISISFYQNWLGEETWVTGFKLGLRIDDAWRMVAFADSDAWADHVEKFNLPVITTGTITYPTSIGRGHFIKKSDIGNQLQPWIQVFAFVGLTLGIPFELQSEISQNLLLKLVVKNNPNGK